MYKRQIFSVAGEELGFIGCTAIIVLLLLYLLRVLYIASKARDDLGRCMCFGFFGLIALQSVSNIGMCLALLPVMGVTLPFFSAGGSSAVCLYPVSYTHLDVYKRQLHACS